MSTGSFFMMVVTEVIVIAITGFFFYKVLTMPKKQEPDSFSENDIDQQ
jgi:hypothetical protein